MKYYLFFLTVFCKASYTQTFEGELKYTGYILQKGSMELLGKPIPEIWIMKRSKYKILLPQAEKGQLEWETGDFVTGFGYSRKTYKNADYIITDKAPTFKNGKLSFEKSDSASNPAIEKRKLCFEKNDTSVLYKKMDTTIIIKGLKCNVINRYKDGIKTNEYYYCDEVRIDSLQYQCFRTDGLDNLYKRTNGSLIVQMVTFDELFTYILQLDSINEKSIDDSVFDLPRDIRIVEALY